MAKKRRNARSDHEMKHRRRKPNIPELVYKYLVADGIVRDVERTHMTKCHCCGQERCHEEIVNSTNSPRITAKSTSHRQPKGKGRVSKSHGVKRHTITKKLPPSCLKKCTDSEDTKKARRWIKDALEFGVDSGYLIPSDSQHKILRVSSELIRSDSRKRKLAKYDRTSSQERDTSPHEGLEENQQQGRRRRRRRRRTRGSRSGSRTRRRSGGRRRGRSTSRNRRGRRCSSPQNPEEVTEDVADDYEMNENDEKADNTHTDDMERESKRVRSNPADEEGSSNKPEDNNSDMSVNEDESDDEEEKKTKVVELE